MRQAAGCLSRLNRFVRSGEGGGSRRNRSERSEQSKPPALRSVAIKLVLVCQRSPATFVRATQPSPNPITTQFPHWHKKDCRP